MGLWFNRNSNQGLVISDVSSSGPISRAGFREGDQVVSVNGSRVASEQQFLTALASPQIQNQRVQVLVARNGQQVPLWVEPWSVMQSSSSGYAQNDPLEQFGLVLDDRYQFPVVWKVTPRSPAYYAGIRNNDVIVTWNGQHVSHPQDLHQVAQQTQANEIPVQISRNRQLRQVTLEADQARTALRPNYDQSDDSQGANQGYQQDQQSGYQPQGAGQQTGGYSQQAGYQQGGYQEQPAYQQGSYQQQPAYQGGYQQQPTYQQGQSGTYQQNTNQGGVLFPRLRGR